MSVFGKVAFAMQITKVYRLHAARRHIQSISYKLSLRDKFLHIKFNDGVRGHFEHGKFVFTRNSHWFDHDEFECIEHCKFLHLTILLDKFDNATVCITVRMESTTVNNCRCKFDHCFIREVFMINSFDNVLDENQFDKCFECV